MFTLKIKGPGGTFLTLTQEDGSPLHFQTAQEANHYHQGLPLVVTAVICEVPAPAPPNARRATFDLCAFRSRPKDHPLGPGTECCHALVGCFTDLTVAIEEACRVLLTQDRYDYVWVRPMTSLGKPLPIACVRRDDGRVHLSGSLPATDFTGGKSL